MRIAFAAMLAAGACASSLQAQTAGTAETGPVVTLDDALRAARAASPSLAAGAAGVDAATAGRSVAALRPNPEVEATSEYFGSGGAYRGFASAENTVRLALPIELGGKRSARVAVADAQIDRSRLGMAIALADLTLAVTQGYNDAVAAERRLTLAGDQARIAGEAARAAGVRVRAGVASPLEQQRADVLRINADAAVERAGRSAEVARTNLARLVGGLLPGRLDQGWFDRVGGYGPVGSSAPEGTLALAAADADLRISGAQVRLARAQRVPDVRVSAGVRRLDATGTVVGVLGVGVPIPLFNNGRAAVSQAQAQAAQAEAQRRVALVEAGRAIANAQADLANAAVTARTATGPALAAAVEAARIARIGYREGKFGQLDLLEAERTLAETRVAAVDALAAYHDAQARLERLVAPAPADVENAR